MAHPTVAASSYAVSQATTTSPAITLASGLVNGQYGLLMVEAGAPSTATLATPAGWTLLYGPIQGGANSSLAWLFSKVMTAAESSSTITMTGSLNTRYSAMFLAFNDAAGVDAVVGASGTPATQTGNAIPSFTPIVDDCLALVLFGAGISAGQTAPMTTTPPSGFTEVVDQSSNRGSGFDMGVYAASKQLTGQAGVAQAAGSAPSSALHRSSVFVVTVRPVAGLPAPAVQAVSTNVGQPASTHPSIVLPTGIQLGDLVYVLVESNNNTTPLSGLPSGWSVVDGPRQGGGNFALGWLLVKDGLATDSGTTATFTLPASTRWATMAVVVRGGAFDQITWASATATTTTVNTIPAYTPVAADCLTLLFMNLPTSSGVGLIATTPPAGYTEVVDQSSNYGSGSDQCVYLATKQLVGQAGTLQTSTTATSTVAHRGNAWLLTIKAQAAPIGGGHTHWRYDGTDWNPQEVIFF